MGILSEYLEKNWNFQSLTRERTKQLHRISQLRSRDGKREILVVAANLRAANLPTGIDYSDLLPVADQLANLDPDVRALDLVLETPGGSGEVAEQIMRVLRERFDDVAVIVPGWAKSAGTIMAMAADDILMGQMSALGPIDAQITWQGRVFSAHALIEGIQKMKDEAQKTRSLNLAYVPILQGISPGDIEHAQNALDFARVLVKEWLTKFKFRKWDKTETSGTIVTPTMREARAEQIADELCKQSRWKTHSRSIRISDLVGLKLRITDYTSDGQLSDAIVRYYTLLQMTFDQGAYKVFETMKSQIVRFAQAGGPADVQQLPGQALVAVLDINCPKCQRVLRVQANMGQPAPLEPGCLAYPKDDRLRCPGCNTLVDLTPHRAQVEAQTRQPVIR